jgi:hypothetical protein
MEMQRNPEYHTHEEATKTSDAKQVSKINGDESLEESKEVKSKNLN